MRLLLVVSVVLLITACSSNDGRKAPTKESELGFLVNKSAQEMRDEGFSAKVISNAEGLVFSEVVNSSAEDILNTFPDALVAKNTFVTNSEASYKPQTESQLLRQFSLQATTTPNFSLEGCIHSPRFVNPVISFVDENSIPNVLLDTDSVLLTSRESESLDGEFQVAWAVVPPKGSNVKNELIPEKELNLSFDMAGVYQVNLFIRQGVHCNVQTIPFPVTNNPAINGMSPQSAELSVNSVLTNSKFAQIELMGVKQAQQNSEKGKGIVVAVLDSGINYNSPALIGKIWKNEKENFDGTDTDGNKKIDDVIGYDFVNDDPYPMDDNGHGSHVAGLIAGTGIGVAQNATIMPVKVMHSLGFSDTGTILSGLVYAILNGADIINMSLGGPAVDPSLVKMYLSIFEAAEKRDILIIAASGNGDPKTGRSLNIDSTPMYPAALQFENILSIGASDFNGNLTYYSNYGVNSVDLVAVGGMDFDISTRKQVNQLLYSAYLPNPNNELLNPLMGTSMAAPIVAGMTALLMGEDSSLTSKDTAELMMSSSTEVSSLNGLVKSSGMANVNEALKQLKARLIN